MKVNYTNEYLIYARKSDENADKQKNSIAYQVRECVRFAKDQKLPIANATIDGLVENGIINERHTAYKTEDIQVGEDGRVHYQIARPKFQRMIQLLAQKKFRGVIVLCWDRVSRNDQDGMVIKKLMEAGVDVRFAWVNYSKSSSGILHMDIDGMFASHYSRVISEKVRASNAKARAEGICLYQAPIGYLNEGRGNRPFDPQRAPLVKRLFEMYVTGEWSISQLTLWAQEQGLTSKPRRKSRSREDIADGKINEEPLVSRPVSRLTVHHTLRNPFYVGKLKYGNEVLEGTHAPLIDLRLFNRVQEILSQRNVSMQYVDRQFFCFRGFVRCTCGRRYSPYEKKGYIYYRGQCTRQCDNPQKNLPEHKIDERVQDILGKFDISEKKCLSIKKKLAESESRHMLEEEAERGDSERKQRRIQEDINYLKQQKVSLLRTEAYSPEEYRQELRRLEEELRGEKEGIGGGCLSSGEISECVISILELLKSARLWYEMALDIEKHDLVRIMGLELRFYGQDLAGFTTKEGFEALLKLPTVQFGGLDLRVLEQPRVISELQESLKDLERLNSAKPSAGQNLFQS